MFTMATFGTLAPIDRSLAGYQENFGAQSRELNMDAELRKRAGKRRRQGLEGCGPRRGFLKVLTKCCNRRFTCKIRRLDVSHR